MDTWRYVRTADHNIGHLTWIWKMRNVNSRNALHGPNEINHGIYGNSSSFFCLQQTTASREKRAAVTHAPGAECGPGPADHTAHRSQSMIWKTRIFPFLSMFRSGQMPLIVNYNLFLFYFILFFEKKRNYLLFSRNHKLSAYINIFIFRLGVKRQLKIWRLAQERRWENMTVVRRNIYYWCFHFWPWHTHANEMLKHFCLTRRAAKMLTTDGAGVEFRPVLLAEVGESEFIFFSRETTRKTKWPTVARGEGHGRAG